MEREADREGGGLVKELKTRTVNLYVDLGPGWHENNDDSLYLWAPSNPSSPKQKHQTRVKITVELPCIEWDYGHDREVEGEAKIDEK